ncbi:hypothetical protein HDV05_002187 [Chytridiales sp. JEL 0842]|nr:hypothetical protein HDV05_002187 [Chytridiales sp. JEL 0842]
MFYYKRFRPEVSPSGWKFIMGQSIAAIIVSLLNTYYAPFKEYIPGIVMFWTANLSVVFWILCKVGRAFRLLILYEWNQKGYNSSEELRNQLYRIANDNSKTINERANALAEVLKTHRRNSFGNGNSTCNLTDFFVAQRRSSPIPSPDNAVDLDRKPDYSGAFEGADTSLKTENGVWRSMFKRHQESPLVSNLEKAVNTYVAKAISCAMIVQLLETLILTIVLPEPVSIYPTVSMGDSNDRIYYAHFIGMYIVILCTLFIVYPGIIYLIRNVQDANGCKRDIIISFTIGIPFMAAWFILVLIARFSPVISNIKNFLPPSALVICICLSVHLSSVILPLWNSYQLDKQRERMKQEEDLKKKKRAAARGALKRVSKVFKHRSDSFSSSSSKQIVLPVFLQQFNPDFSYESFIGVLRDPVMAVKFKKFAAADFNIEAAIFHESVIFLQKAFDVLTEMGQIDYYGTLLDSYHLPDTGSIDISTGTSQQLQNSITDSPAMEALEGQFLYIYNTFIMPGSLMEVKCLSPTVKYEIEVAIMEHRYDRDLFQKADQQTLRYLFHILALVNAMGFLAHLLLGVAAQTPLPEKVDVVRIGALLSFQNQYAAGDVPAMMQGFGDHLTAVSMYDYMLKQVELINSNPNILPTTRLELVPLNSAADRGRTLMSTLELAQVYNVSAVVGEIYSRNTIGMATVSAIQNLFHCAPSTIAPALSNKADFPTTVRTQVANTFQVKGLVGIMRFFNITSFGLVASGDEAGQGFVQEIISVASRYNITVIKAVITDLAKPDYSAELETMIRYRAQTIISFLSGRDGVRFYGNAQALGMLNGDYVFMAPNGMTPNTFSSPEELKIINAMRGFWQVEDADQPDTVFNPKFPDTYNMAQWWTNLFVPNNSTGGPLPAGYPIEFNPNIIVPFPPTGPLPASNCDPNIPYLRTIANQIQPFPFTRAVGNTTRTFLMMGNQCIDNGKILLGWLPLFAASKGFMYMKAGRINITQVQNRRWMSALGGNLTQIINNASIPNFQGGTYKVDHNADLIVNPSIINLRPVQMSSAVTLMASYPVGTFDIEKDQAFIPQLPDGRNNYFFLGNATAPPPPPVIPVFQYQAKMSLRYAIDALVGVCSLFTLLVAVYMILNINFKIFKASAPRFLALILLGTNISFISIWIYSQYPMDDKLCVTYGWLKYMGFAVVFGALIVKTYRISAIFTQKKNKQRNLNDGMMFIYFLIFMAVWVAILVVWTAVPSLTPKLVIDSIPEVAKNGTLLSYNTTPRCEFTAYNYVCLGAMVITLAIGVVITYQIRNTPSAFNESKYIAMATYNWVVIGVVLNAISNFAVKDPDVIFVTESLIVIITQTGVVGFLFVPKMFEIRAGRGNDNNTFMSTNHSNSASGSQTGRKPSVAGGSQHVGTSSASSAPDLEKKVEELKKQVEKLTSENVQLRRNAVKPATDATKEESAV